LGQGIDQYNPRNRSRGKTPKRGVFDDRVGKKHPKKAHSGMVLSNNRVLMPHLVIAHAMSAQHLGRKTQLFDKVFRH